MKGIPPETAFHVRYISSRFRVRYISSKYYLASGASEKNFSNITLCRFAQTFPTFWLEITESVRNFDEQRCKKRDATSSKSARKVHEKCTKSARKVLALDYSAKRARFFFAFF